MPIFSNVVDDTSPQLGGNLDVNGNKIVATGLGADIHLEPDAAGSLNVGAAMGTQYTATINGLEVAGGDPSAAHHIYGIGAWLHEFKVGGLDLSNDFTGLRFPNSASEVAIDIGSTEVSSLTASAFSVGNYTFNIDQTVGAGNDGQVLAYDHATGEITLSAAAGGGLSDLVDDTTPQLGGNLDLNFSQIVETGETVTLSKPLLDLAQTWDDALVAFEGLKFAVTNTNSLDSLYTTGTSKLINVTVNGNDLFHVQQKNGNRGKLVLGDGISTGESVFLTSSNNYLTLGGQRVYFSLSDSTGYAYIRPYASTNGPFSYANSLQIAGHTANARLELGSFVTAANSDSTFPGEAVVFSSGGVLNVLGHTLTDPQMFRIYNTFTDASNYERAVFGFVGDTLYLKNESAGTGVARNFLIESESHFILQSGVNRGIRLVPDEDSNKAWLFDSNGHLTPYTSGSTGMLDIGSTSRRVRSLKIGNNSDSLTVSSPMIDALQIWNDGTETFVARTTSITDTASAAGSLLDQMQVDALTVWSVDKNGSFGAFGVTPPSQAAHIADVSVGIVPAYETAINAIIAVLEAHGMTALS